MYFRVLFIRRADILLNEALFRDLEVLLAQKFVFYHYGNKRFFGYWCALEIIGLHSLNCPQLSGENKPKKACIFHGSFFSSHREALWTALSQAREGEEGVEVICFWKSDQHEVGSTWNRTRTCLVSIQCSLHKKQGCQNTSRHGSNYLWRKIITPRRLASVMTNCDSYRIRVSHH